VILSGSVDTEHRLHLETALREDGQVVDMRFMGQAFYARGQRLANCLSNSERGLEGEA
jgi:hypothetical protein